VTTDAKNAKVYSPEFDAENKFMTGGQLLIGKSVCNLKRQGIPEMLNFQSINFGFVTTILYIRESYNIQIF
jgi:hypothetical protein